MDTVIEEKRTADILAGAGNKRYIRLSYEDIKEISDELIEQNMEAYLALADA